MTSFSELLNCFSKVGNGTTSMAQLEAHCVVRLPGETRAIYHHLSS